MQNKVSFFPQPQKNFPLNVFINLEISQNQSSFAPLYNRAIFVDVIV